MVIPLLANQDLTPMLMQMHTSMEHQFNLENNFRYAALR